MLRYSKEKLDKEDSITKIYYMVQDELEARRKLYEEYRRKASDSELASENDEEIKVPFQRYLATMAVGYFAGKPPIYKVHAYDEEIDNLSVELFDTAPNSEEKVKEMEYIIKHITDYNDDGNEFLNLAFDYFVKRACYEMLYKNTEGEIVYAVSDALETVAIWDFSVPKQLIGLYRIINQTLADGKKMVMVELTTEKGKRYYQADAEKLKTFANNEAGNEEKAKFKEDKKQRQGAKWTNLQVVAIENEDNMNIFESVSSLINAYERVIQNSRNVFKYNDEAILMVKGYSPENDMIIKDASGTDMVNQARLLEDQQVLESRVRYIDADGDLKWVTKDVNDNALQNHKKTLVDLICMLAFVPNMQDLGFTNADNSSALEKKFFSLQQYVARAKGDFIQGLNRRWELIFDKFNKDKGKDYDFRNVEITIEPNIPTDMASMTDLAMKLRDILSDETVIGLLPFNFDPKNEIAKKETESQEQLEKNQENMSNFNQLPQGVEMANEEEPVNVPRVGETAPNEAENTLE